MISSVWVESLDYQYPKARRPALVDVAFEGVSGEIHGIVGHNGAGKTTLLMLIAGIYSPTHGCVMIDDAFADSRVADPAIGLLSDRLALYGKFTVRETCRVFARLHKVADEDRAVEGAIELLQLGSHSDVQVRRLSSGLKKRLALSIVEMPHPTLLLLDEPFAGIDPESTERILELLRQWREEGRTIFVSSHDLPELSSVADRITILRQGRVLASSTLAELRTMLDSNEKTAVVMTSEGSYEVPLEPAPLRDLFAELSVKGATVLDVSPKGLSLSEIYMRLHREAGTASPAGSKKPAGDAVTHSAPEGHDANAEPRAAG
jgi:ABC-type multidrug transport system ATPase subunit